MIRSLPLRYSQVPELSEAFAEYCHNHLAHAKGFVGFNSILRTRLDLTQVQKGNAFWLQMGPCHENIHEGVLEVKKLWELVSSLLAQTEILTQKRVIPVLRATGQMVKPRSLDYETQGDFTLPSFRGHMLHEYDFKRNARRLSEERVVRAYRFSKEIYKTLQEDPSFSRIGAVSHEALLLHYEAAFLERWEGKLFSSSANLLWIGARTNQPTGEHAKFLSPLLNPIGIKVGPSMTPESLLELLHVINPKNEEGKILLIARLGAKAKESTIAALIKAVKQHALHVAWVIDPMHGNIEKTKEGQKTRILETMLQESFTFMKLLQKLDVPFGGVHLEAGAGDFQECLCLGEDSKKLKNNFKSLCDPRLNEQQSRRFVLDLARFFHRIKRGIA